MSSNSLSAILVLQWQHLELVEENHGSFLLCVCVCFVIILGLSFIVYLIWLVFGLWF